MPRIIADPQVTSDGAHFEERLVTRQNPGFLRPLAHALSPSAPAGVIRDLVEPTGAPPTLAPGSIATAAPTQPLPETFARLQRHPGPRATGPRLTVAVPPTHEPRPMPVAAVPHDDAHRATASAPSAGPAQPDLGAARQGSTVSRAHDEQPSSAADDGPSADAAAGPTPSSPLEPTSGTAGPAGGWSPLHWIGDPKDAAVGVPGDPARARPRPGLGAPLPGLPASAQPPVQRSVSPETLVHELRGAAERRPTPVHVVPPRGVAGDQGASQKGLVPTAGSAAAPPAPLPPSRSVGDEEASGPSVPGSGATDLPPILEEAGRTALGLWPPPSLLDVLPEVPEVQLLPWRVLHPDGRPVTAGSSESLARRAQEGTPEVAGGVPRLPGLPRMKAVQLQPRGTQSRGVRPSGQRQGAPDGRVGPEAHPPDAPTLTVAQRTATGNHVQVGRIRTWADLPGQSGDRPSAVSAWPADGPPVPVGRTSLPSRSGASTPWHADRVAHPHRTDGVVARLPVDGMGVAGPPIRAHAGEVALHLGLADRDTEGGVVFRPAAEPWWPPAPPVQRSAVPPAPAATANAAVGPGEPPETSQSAQPAPSARSIPTSDELEALAIRLYPRISRQLRLELIRERDRVGSITDFRH